MNRAGENPKETDNKGVWGPKKISEQLSEKSKESKGKVGEYLLEDTKGGFYGDTQT